MTCLPLGLRPTEGSSGDMMDQATMAPPHHRPVRKHNVNKLLSQWSGTGSESEVGTLLHLDAPRFWALLASVIMKTPKELGQRLSSATAPSRGSLSAHIDRNIKGWLVLLQRRSSTSVRQSLWQLGETYIIVALDSIDESLISHDLRLPTEEGLETFFDCLQLLFTDLGTQRRSTGKTQMPQLQ